jgi:hypothetical protein
MCIEASATKADPDSDCDSDPDENTIANAEFPITPICVTGKLNLAPWADAAPL